MKKPYNNKIVRNTINAYVKSVMLYDTGSIWLHYKSADYDYAEWHNGTIYVRLHTGDEEPNNEYNFVPLKGFDVEQQKIIIDILLKALNDDLKVFL